MSEFGTMLAQLLVENIAIWHKFGAITCGNVGIWRNIGATLAQLGKKLKRILINYI
jgi:hypothetical protein